MVFCKNKISACKILLALVGLATLASCGGGNQPASNSNSATDDRRSALAVASGAEIETIKPQVVSIEKISEVRVNRTAYDYKFKVVIKNGVDAATKVVARVVATGNGTSIVDGSVDAGQLSALAQTTPADTITLRHDRLVPFEPGSLRWQFELIGIIPPTETDLAGVGIANINTAQVTLLPGQSIKANLAYTITTAQNFSEFRINAESSKIQSSARILGDGEAILNLQAPETLEDISDEINIRISNLSLGKYANIKIPASILKPTIVGQGMIGSAGGKISTSIGEIIVSSSSIAEPALLKVEGYQTANGRGRLRITSDRDISNATGMSLQLPPLNSNADLQIGERTTPIQRIQRAILGKPVGAPNESDATCKFTEPVTINQNPYRDPGEAFGKWEKPDKSTLGSILFSRQGYFASPGFGDTVKNFTRLNIGLYRPELKNPVLGFALASSGIDRLAIAYALGQAQQFRVRGTEAIVIDGNQPLSNEGSTSQGNQKKILVDFETLPASTLHAALISKHTGSCNAIDLIKQINWSDAEPVLFIHGFTPTGLGGGESTWGNFPRIAAQRRSATAHLVPFEFQWRTNADFSQVATELGIAINFIHRHSGKRVHIVAHSFGGALVRTLMQGLATDAPDNASGIMKDAIAAISDVVTLGTPHSGIFEKDTITNEIGSQRIAFAAGQNSDSFGLCLQISCRQMGAPVPFIDNYQAFIGTQSTLSKTGGLAWSLANTAETLPEVPIYVGIGLSTTGGSYRDGDYLISFAGQRFLPGATTAAASSASLLKQQHVGRATISEFVLGASDSARPGAAAQVGKYFRKNGYAHSATTGLDYIFGKDGYDSGLEAAPGLLCHHYSTCTHDGYQLFQSILLDPEIGTSRDASPLDPKKPMKLLLAPAVEATLSTSEKTELEQALAALADDGLISKNVIRWDAMPLATANKMSGLLQRTILPKKAANDPVLVKLQGLDADYQNSLTIIQAARNIEVSRANSLIVWDAANAATFADLAYSSAKLLKATYETFGPISAVAVNGISTFEIGYPSGTLLNSIKALAESAKLKDFLKACGSAGAEVVLTLDESASTGKIDGRAMAKASLQIFACLDAAISGREPESNLLKAVGAAAKATVELDGKTVPIFKAVGSMVSGAVGMLPKSEVTIRIQGFLSILDEAINLVVLGQELADHTNSVVSDRISNVGSIFDKSTDRVLRDRGAFKAAALSSGVFIATESTFGTLRSAGSYATAYELTKLWLGDVWASVRSIIVDFGAGAAKEVVAIAGGISSALTHVFDVVGETAVGLSFMDADNGQGAILGATSASISVRPTSVISMTAAITSIKTASGIIIPDQGTTSETRPTVSGTLSARLSSYFSVWVYLDDARLAPATVDGTSWTYTATSDIPVGAHKFTVAVVRFDGVEGPISAPWRLTVSATPASSGLVGYWSFNDCTATDNSGNGGNGQLVGSPVCEQGVAGSGMRLNSTNWIDVPSRPSLEFTTSFTISTWFKAEALTDERSVRLVDKTAAGVNDGYLLSVWASGLSLIGGGPFGVVSNPIPITNNVYHHAVVTFGNGIASFYLDGVPIGSRAVGAMSMFVNPNRGLRIGASQGPDAHPTLNNFGGVIDEVRLYNTMLSSSDVSSLYLAISNSVKLNTANGHRYEIINCGTWTQCRDAAVAKGGTLVTVRSQAENEWIIANILPQVNSTRNVWIGYFRATAGGKFQWASGESSSFEKWYVGEPNNSGGNENCVNTIRDVTYGGYWNDIRCDHPDITQAIVEYIPLCGSVTSPGVVGQQGPAYTVTAGQATRFITTPVPNNGYPFGAYRWKTSEGAEILSTIEQANVTFTSAGAGSVTVTPILADGTVCTGSAATSSVTVTNVGQFLPSIGSTTWKTVDFETNFTPIRINTLGRVECASNDGINCFWGTRAESMGNPSKPLVCTDVQHSDSDHWCGQIYALRNLTWTPNTSNGRYYGLANCGTWRMCASKADFLGVKMVTVRSLIENNWLVSNFPMTQHYWIGATNGGIVGAWRWVSGEAFGYSNWGNNLNNQGGNENCAHFYNVTPGVWNDLRCDSPEVTKAIFEHGPAASAVQWRPSDPNVPWRNDGHIVGGWWTYSDLPYYSYTQIVRVRLPTPMRIGDLSIAFSLNP